MTQNPTQYKGAPFYTTSGYRTCGSSWHDSNFLVNDSNLTYVRARCHSLKLITTCELGVLRV
jgi:hypothetical protein